jgi:hypothetical protein
LGFSGCVLGCMGSIPVRWSVCIGVAASATAARRHFLHNDAHDSAPLGACWCGFSDVTDAQVKLIVDRGLCSFMLFHALDAESHFRKCSSSSPPLVPNLSRCISTVGADIFTHRRQQCVAVRYTHHRLDTMAEALAGLGVAGKSAVLIFLYRPVHQPTQRVSLPLFNSVKRLSARALRMAIHIRMHPKT